MNERDSLCAARIVFAPFQQPDGSWSCQDEVVEPPLSIELDGEWLHVLDYDQLGSAVRLRSYPARVVESVIWRQA